MLNASRSVENARAIGDEITVKEVVDEAGMRDVLELRQRVYVADQNRLGSIEDTKDTFDKFDQYGTYFVAYRQDVALGAVKIIRDSELGLPCESEAPLTVDLHALRKTGRLVEFGHLVSSPEVRSRGIGMQLMKHGLMFSIAKHQATHILGDFFADENGNFQSFYTRCGFRPASAAYRDARFTNAPLSIVGIAEIGIAFQMWRHGTEEQRKMLDFFFAGYDQYEASAAAAAK